MRRGASRGARQSNRFPRFLRVGGHSPLICSSRRPLALRCAPACHRPATPTPSSRAPATPLTRVVPPQRAPSPVSAPPRPPPLSQCSVLSPRAPAPPPPPPPPPGPLDSPPSTHLPRRGGLGGRRPPPPPRPPPPRGRRGGALHPPRPRPPPPLRAADSDDPSDDDDPAAELTAEELALALADLPPPAEGSVDVADGDDGDDDGQEAWDLSPAAFAASAAGSAGGSGSGGGADDDGADARALALDLAAAASAVKAADVCVLHVAPLVYWTSYMVLATVTSRPQLQAVLARAEAAASGGPHGRDLDGARNPGRSAWEVLDFGDVVLHVFTPDQREFYDLEGFYGAAEEVPFEAAGGGGVEWAKER